MILNPDVVIVCSS